MLHVHDRTRRGFSTCLILTLGVRTCRLLRAVVAFPNEAFVDGWCGVSPQSQRISAACWLHAHAAFTHRYAYTLK